MNQIFINSRIRIQKNQVVQIERSLPTAIGKINVKTGDEVAPDFILAEGKKSSGFGTINLAEELGVDPKEGLKYLRREMGRNIFKDELLAEKEGVMGLNKKIILSPTDGILDYYDPEAGRLKIKLFPKTVKLACGVWGIIEEVDEGRGIVIIKTMASLIYGVMGSGKEREGTLNVLGSKEVLVGSRQLEATMRGQVIIGGEIIFADGLEKAIEMGIVGIVSGGINAKDYKGMVGGYNISRRQWSDVGLSLVITEGFGSVHMGDDIFSLFSQNHGKFSIIDGNRNKIILPVDDNGCMADIRRTKLPKKIFVEALPAQNSTKLEIGQRIRIISEDYLGTQGVIEAIDKTPSKLSSGACTIMVTIDCGSRKIRSAYQNLEIII